LRRFTGLSDDLLDTRKPLCYGAAIKKGVTMAKKEILNKLSIYIPQAKMEKQPVERLIKLGPLRSERTSERPQALHQQAEMG
jgi:hypothetical protein